MPRPKKNVAKKAPVKRTRRAKLFVDEPKPAIADRGHNYIDTAMRRDALQYAIGLPATNGEEVLANARKIYEFLAGKDYPPVPKWDSITDSLSPTQVNFGDLEGPSDPLAVEANGVSDKPRSRFDAHTL